MLVTVAAPPTTTVVLGEIELVDIFVVIDAVIDVELLELPTDTCDDAPTLLDHLYSDSPYGPPHTCELLPLQSMKQRPSVVDVLPLMRVLPQ